MVGTCVQVMGPGMNYHLTVNPMLREILELGAPLPIYEVDSMHKPSKTERVSILTWLKETRTCILVNSLC